MPTPSELVTELFADAQSRASNAAAQMEAFTARLNAAIQIAPLVDLTFTPITDPGSTSAPTFSGAYSAPSDFTDGSITTIAALIGTLDTTVLARLAGGTGLATAVEAAIWDRARGRELTTAQAKIDEVTAQAESLGFELPPGVLNEGIRRETSAYYDSVSSLSRDVAVKQAELEQANMQRAIEQANQFIASASEFENVLSQINQRRAQVAVEVYRGEVEAFRASIEGFRAEVEQDVKHWEVQIKQLEAEMTFIQENAKINTEISRANLATLLEAAKAGAQVFAQLTAAAYSLIHATAGVSASAQDQVSYNYSGGTTEDVFPIPTI